MKKFFDRVLFDAPADFGAGAIDLSGATAVDATWSLPPAEADGFEVDYVIDHLTTDEHAEGFGVYGLAGGTITRSESLAFSPGTKRVALALNAVSLNSFLDSILIAAGTFDPLTIDLSRAAEYDEYDATGLSTLTLRATAAAQGGVAAVTITVDQACALVWEVDAGAPAGTWIDSGIIGSSPPASFPSAGSYRVLLTYHPDMVTGAPTNRYSALIPGVSVIAHRHTDWMDFDSVAILTHTRGHISRSLASGTYTFATPGSRHLDLTGAAVASFDVTLGDAAAMGGTTNGHSELLVSVTGDPGPHTIRIIDGARPGFVLVTPLMADMQYRFLWVPGGPIWRLWGMQPLTRRPAAVSAEANNEFSGSMWMGTTANLPGTPIPGGFYAVTDA